MRIGTEVTPFLAEKDIPGHSENLRNLASSVENLEVGPTPSPASAPAPSASASAGAAAPSANNSAQEQKIQSVMSVTGATRQQVIDALRACNGNADAAAQMLSGFNF